MAPVRYSKIVPEPERVLAEVERTRGLLVQAASKVRPQGPAYCALHMVTSAIDGLAAFMTGERHYFASRYEGETSSPTAAPGLDLDESPHAGSEELARLKAGD